MYPEQWSKEIKLPFLKPGKDPNLPSSYRPISLTSCICKLFERMVNHRMMWFLEKNNILCPEQSGFRKHQERHPTVHIYTDCSKSTESVGFAAVFLNTTSGGRLAREASIFTTELYAINAAVHES